MLSNESERATMEIETAKVRVKPTKTGSSKRGGSRKVGLIVAVLLTALGFAGIHIFQLGYAWAPILSIFVVGVVFTVVRQRWSSVASSFLMHCGYNFTLFSLLWYASDHFRHLEKAAG